MVLIMLVPPRTTTGAEQSIDVTGVDTLLARCH